MLAEVNGYTIHAPKLYSKFYFELKAIEASPPRMMRRAQFHSFMGTKIILSTAKVVPESNIN